jgi:hypothetical protein
MFIRAGYGKFLHIPSYSWLLESLCFFLNSRADEAVNYQTTKIIMAMKKLFIFLFLLSSVSFVGCAKKTEAPVEAPVEAPAAPAAPAAAPAAEAPAAAPAAPAAEAPAAK